MPVARSVLEAIGSTPIVELRRIVPAGSARILVKLEGTNPTGSMKDRMALAAIEAAEADGRLRGDLLGHERRRRVASRRAARSGEDDCHASDRQRAQVPEHGALPERPRRFTGLVTTAPRRRLAMRARR